MNHRPVVRSTPRKITFNERKKPMERASLEFSRERERERERRESRLIRKSLDEKKERGRKGRDR